MCGACYARDNMLDEETFCWQTADKCNHREKKCWNTNDLENCKQYIGRHYKTCCWLCNNQVGNSK